MLPYNRALHPDDYGPLAPYVEKLTAFQQRCSALGIPYRKDHQHRDWEYASLLRVLDEQQVPAAAAIHDAGSGASYLAPYLAADGGYKNVTVSDSMAYGDIEQTLIEQCLGLGILIPMKRVAIEALTAEYGHEAFDVTCCVSTIEHVDASLFDAAMRELVLVTKPGGLIYLTTDLFEKPEDHASSPFRGIQQTVFTPQVLVALPSRFALDYVENTDFTYRGHFVHNYSFASMVFRRRA